MADGMRLRPPWRFAAPLAAALGRLRRTGRVVLLAPALVSIRPSFQFF
jgi:hypothetical protein